MLDERVEKRRWIFEYYKEAPEDLPGIEFMPEAPYGKSIGREQLMARDDW